MKYVSTRRGVEPCTLSEAILAGLAKDRGLFVPESIPQVRFEAGTLPRVAAQVLAPFFEGDGLEAELLLLVQEAFTFDAPVVPTRRADTTVLQLFHGPTAAFKDFGARFLAACFRRLVPPRFRRVSVVVATSGDTGSAVGAAFHGMPGVQVAILYPESRVSARQAHQLGSFGDNVHALVVKGNFDDCQRLVKEALADEALRAREPLASANSVSLGRLLPQLAYYVRASLEHRGRGPLNFAIPTGNLGNAFACLLARAMGAPIGDVLLATNANRTIPDFVETTVPNPRESVATLANAMDVGDPSNLERLRWLHASPGQAGVFADSVDDEAISDRIKEGESRYGHVFCPHTACAVEAVERRRRHGDLRDWCVVATAHPAKFETVVEPLVGHPVELPPALAQMLARHAHAEPLEPDFSALRAWLLRR